MSVSAGALLALDGFVVLFTVLPLIPRPGWWSRIGDFPRVQLVFLATVLLVVQIPLFADLPIHWLLHFVLIACIAYQLTWIVPYTPIFPHEVLPALRPPDEARCISVLSANVLMSNRNVAALHSLIEACDPDIVLLLETNQWWQDRVQDLRKTHPHGLDCPLDNRYGMHLYSRLKLVDPCIDYLVEDDVPSMHTDVELESGHHVRLRCLHPAPPSPTENATSRERDAELLVVARSIAEDNRSVIATGDFNDVAWSKTTRLFRKISRLLDPRIGRGMFTTFHASIPLLRFPLDHVFHSRDFTLVSLRVMPKFGSDHLPIYYKLQHEPRAAKFQHAPKADDDDHERARKKVSEMGVKPADVPDPGRD